MRVIFFVFLICAATAATATGNPYCVAGYGVLTKLGMPTTSTDYDWNGLHPGHGIQMCRPNHYYTYVGIPPRWWGYDEATGQINDPTQFATWVAANPGQTWIISNEPDIWSQDGLTTDQYVAMFRTYHTFIGAIDPTAKFAIAGITGGSTAERLTATTNWFNEVLAKYRAAYGSVMPVDVWNVHSYCGPLQVEDPDKIISEFITPFVNYCHTVESGAYAGCEVWITELPIGEWMGAISVPNTIDFMQRYLPRLESAGIARWFWYVSSDWDGSQGSCALIKGGAVTPVGAAYAALAAGYPNEVPPVVPFSPAPAPDVVTADFSVPLADPWFVKGGYWGVADGVLRHTGYYPFAGTTVCLLHKYRDMEISFRAKIDSAAEPPNWVAVVLRAGGRFHTGWDSGYLVLLRQNGELGIYNKVDAMAISVPGAVSDTAVWHTWRVSVVGGRIRVFIDDELKIDWTDPFGRFTSGYPLIQVHRVDASYDDVEVKKLSALDMSLDEIRRLPAGRSVVTAGKIVSGVFPGYVYVQETDGSSGLRVVGDLQASPGDEVALTGTTGVVDKEAVLLGQITSATAGEPPGPVHLSTLSAGGAGVGLQLAPIDSDSPPRFALGLNPMGLLVRIAGAVTYVDPGGMYAYVDDGCGLRDGSGQTGIRISTQNLPTPRMGSLAEVTGCCGAASVGSNCARILRPRDSADVYFSDCANYLGNGSFEGSIACWQQSGSGGGVVDRIMTIRAQSGTYFWGVYAYNSTFSGVLRQTIAVPDGVYAARVQSRVYHGSNPTESAMNRIGIDPAGGSDPASPNVMWSAWDTQTVQYASAWREIITPSVDISSGRCSVFLEYQQSNTAGYHANCFDSALVVRL